MRNGSKKNSFKNIFLSLFKNLFTSTLDTTIISKMSNTHWHPGKRCCIPLHEKNLSKFWLKILFVTSHNASGPNVEMRPVCHKSHPRPNRSKWYSNGGIRVWSAIEIVGLNLRTAKRVPSGLFLCHTHIFYTPPSPPSPVFKNFNDGRRPFYKDFNFFNSTTTNACLLSQGYSTATMVPLGDFFLWHLFLLKTTGTR